MGEVTDSEPAGHGHDHVSGHGGHGHGLDGHGQPEDNGDAGHGPQHSSQNLALNGHKPASGRDGHESGHADAGH
eukprot:2385068-Rhodomonas_salina.1